MNLKTLSLLGALVITTIGADGSVNVGISIGIGRPAPVIVRQAPPRRAAEVIIASPGPGHVWIAGHNSWRDGQWVWVPGAWVVPPQPGTVWVEGRWDEGTNSWTPEHWEYTQTTPPPAVQTGPTTPPPAVVVAPAPAPTVVVRVAPPPLRHERRPHRPGPGFAWVNGFWTYRGGQYVWVSGHWDRISRGHRVWVEPRWERRGDTYVFIEGRWH